MKQNKLTIIFFSLLVALAFMACNDDLLEKHPLDASGVIAYGTSD